MHKMPGFRMGPLRLCLTAFMAACGSCCMAGLYMFVSDGPEGSGQASRLENQLLVLSPNTIVGTPVEYGVLKTPCFNLTPPLSMDCEGRVCWIRPVPCRRFMVEIRHSRGQCIFTSDSEFSSEREALAVAARQVPLGQPLLMWVMHGRGECLLMAPVDPSVERTLAGLYLMVNGAALFLLLIVPVWVVATVVCLRRAQQRC